MYWNVDNETGRMKENTEFYIEGNKHDLRIYIEWNKWIISYVIRFSQVNFYFHLLPFLISWCFDCLINWLRKMVFISHWGEFWEINIWDWQEKWNVITKIVKMFFLSCLRTRNSNNFHHHWLQSTGKVIICSECVFW